MNLKNKLNRRSICKAVFALVILFGISVTYKLSSCNHKSSHGLKDKGLIYVVSGPSGVGKTTAVRRMIQSSENKFVEIVSYTSRDRRSNELDGVDYNFVSLEAMKDMIADKEICEFAMVYGNYYGISCKDIDTAIVENKIPVLVIDREGLSILRDLNYNVVSVFLLPESLEILKNRLIGRGTDSQKIIDARMSRVVEDIKTSSDYEYLLVSYTIDGVARQLDNIGRAADLLAKTTKIRQSNEYQDLLNK